MLKPRISKQAGQSTQLKHSQSDPQEQAQVVRPQLPRDYSAGGVPIYTSGTMPKGGFQSIWGFGDNRMNTKDSPTTKPGKKIY
jgi:hypothetical protein